MAVSVGIEPLYMKNNDLPMKDMTPYNICQAMARVVGQGNVDGAQRVRNIWRLYLKDRKSRADIFVKQELLVNGKHIQIYDRNPQDILSKTQINDKLTIKDIPMDVSNSEIREVLEKEGVRFVSPIKDSYERDLQGNLTSYRNGDRFAYIMKMDTIVKRTHEIGQHIATVIHHGRDNRPCRGCNQIGHKIGSQECPALPENSIYAFKSYQNPLSNHYPCELIMFGEVIPFKSFEHALFWKMAMDHGKPSMAYFIKEAEHAGVAKTMSKVMPDAEREEWEDENKDVIKCMLYEKFKQCPEFRQTISDNKDATFAEAGSNMKWASGLPPHITQKTNPDFWPGENMLGKLITLLAKNYDSLLNEIATDIYPGSKTPPPTKRDGEGSATSQEEGSNDWREDEDLNIEEEKEQPIQDESNTVESMDENPQRGRTRRRAPPPQERTSRSESSTQDRRFKLPTIPGEDEDDKEFMVFLDEAHSIIKGETEKPIAALEKQSELEVKDSEGNHEPG